MQRRNRGNELIVAIAVVGTLTVALTFAIILTLTGSKDTPSESRQTRTVAAVLPDTVTPTVPLPSDTPTLTLTATPTPTDTLVPTATVTLIPSITPRPSATPTDIPSATSTSVPSALPTDTPTLTPTLALTATSTPTFTPSVTPSRTPSLTPSQTFTPSRTPTFTPVPSTLTFTPYPSLTPSVTPFGGDRTSTPSGSGCVVPADWLAYTVQRGDTLYRLSLRFSIALQDLAAANCITDPANITAGQILYAPPGSNVTPSAPAAPAGVAGGMTRFDCGNPAATITQPVPGTVLRGAFAIYGTATHPDFQFYRLQISGSGTNDTDFATLMVYPGQVINGQLGTVNTAAFAPGVYWLRLTVVDNTGNYLPQCTVQVRFES